MKRIILFTLVALFISTPAFATELVRQKNVATVITFPLLGTDGKYVSGEEVGAKADSEYCTWADGTTVSGFTDIAAEIDGISESGFYYVTMSQAEMNNDYILYRITSDNSIGNAMLIRTVVGDPLNVATTDDGGEINVASGVVEANVEQVLDTAVSASEAGVPNVNVTRWDDYPVTDSDGTPDVNMTQISGDSTAADNIESTYDGTGYVDGVAPSTQDQVSGVGSIGGVLNQVPEAYTQTTGTTVSGTYTEVYAVNATYHQIEDDGGTLDVYYQFDIGSTGTAAGFSATGRVNGGNDDLTVYAYDWVGNDWETVRSYDAQVSTVDAERTGVLLPKHTGVSGAEKGKVRVRFQGTGLTSADLYIDQLFITYGVVQSSVGYADGSIWVDTVNGTAGTAIGTNGTADNPVLTWADAVTLSNSTNLLRFHLVSNSSITLTGSSDSYHIVGYGSTVALDGQSISGTYFEGVKVTGNDDGSNVTPPRFRNCTFTTNTLGQFRANQSPLTADITLAEAGTYIFEGCLSAVAGTATPSVDVGAALADTNLNFRHYSGGIEVKNFGANGTDNMSLEGNGQLVLENTCAGGTVAIRGNFTVTDNSNGLVTLSDDARYDVDQVSAEMVRVVNATTWPELTGTDDIPAAGTLTQMTRLRYMIDRNKKTTTSATHSVTNNAGTVILERALSDDGTVFEAQEVSNP